MRVYRAPIAGIFTKIANALTNGGLKKKQEKLGYDDIYHLSLRMQLRKDKSVQIIKLEKNETVQINISSFAADPGQKTQYAFINRPINETLKEFYEKGRAAYLDDREFFGYDSINNNCQQFMNTMLKANGISSPQLTEFIMQDSMELLGRDFPALREIMSGITDLAQLWSRIHEGD